MSALKEGQRLALKLGDESRVVSSGRWERRGGTYVATFRPPGALPGSGRCRVVVNPARRHWSLSITRARLDSGFVRRCLAGLAPVSLSVNGDARGPFGFPVAVRATLVSQPSPKVKSTTKTPSVARPLSLRRATVACAVVRTKRTSAATFALRGVKMSRSLFRTSGIGVDVNGQQFDTGHFSRQGREWVARGTTPTGIEQVFRYSVANGLTLRLGGRRSCLSCGS